MRDLPRRGSNAKASQEALQNPELRLMNKHPPYVRAGHPPSRQRPRGGWRNAETLRTSRTCRNPNETFSLQASRDKIAARPQNCLNASWQITDIPSLSSYDDLYATFGSHSSGGGQPHAEESPGRFCNAGISQWKVPVESASGKCQWKVPVELTDTLYGVSTLDRRLKRLLARRTSGVF
jgi:hypothetical protein